jgi:hydrogenase maturation protease
VSDAPSPEAPSPEARAPEAPAAAPVRVIALGNAMACDDGAALRAAERLADDPGVEVVLAGRPGPGLLELFDPAVPTVLVDVVRLGCAAGNLVEMSIADVSAATIDGKPLSSHGLGVTQALRLAEALGRPLPRGIFVGIGGRRFDPGDALDPEVEAGVADLVEAIRGAVAALRG